LSLFLLGHYQKEQSPKNFGLDLGNNDCQACILPSFNAQTRCFSKLRLYNYATLKHLLNRNIEPGQQKGLLLISPLTHVA
jgi:hypothetical protein